MSVISAFKPGDHIEVTPLEKDLGTHKDWGILRGTAMDEVHRSGSAIFYMEAPLPLAVAPGDTAMLLRFNANEVDVRLLFSADMARRVGPK